MQNLLATIITSHSPKIFIRQYLYSNNLEDLRYGSAAFFAQVYSYVAPAYNYEYINAIASLLQQPYVHIQYTE